MDDATDPASKHACSAALTTYEIEFNNKRALDDLIWAKSFLSQLPPDIKPKDPVEVSNAALKYAKIPGELEHAVQERFRSLKALKK